MLILITLFIGAIGGFTCASINAVNAYERGYRDGREATHDGLVGVLGDVEID